MRERDFLLKKARRTGNEFDWILYRKARNATTRAIKSSKANYNRIVLSENLSRPKQFWNRIKKCYHTKNTASSTPKSFQINDKIVSDEKLITDGFCSYFTEIGKSLQRSIFTLGDKTWKYYNHSSIQGKVNPKNALFNFKLVTSKDITLIIKSLNTSTSPGYDNIPVSLLKDGMNELSKPLTNLINKCIAQSVFPSAEKKARIIPIYKSSEQKLMTNYRPISVLPVLSKVFELTVHHQLYEYLEENNLLSNVQFGFRKNRSSQHAVTLLTDHIRTHIDRGECTGAVFMDLSKAFDTVDHGCLISKLVLYGIRNIELCWFESYLFNRKQYVQFKNSSSNPQSTITGVPQGSILGPLLFVLLMNDIECGIKKCKIFLYADDAVLFASNKDSSIIEQDLNSDVIHIGSWFNDNNLVINLKEGKTEFMMFGSPQKIKKSTEVKIVFNNSTVTETRTYKYLGVLFDKSLNYAAHLDKVYKKASGRIKLLSRIRCDLNPYAAEMIYKMMVAPIIYYCSNIFLGNSMLRFQKLHERAYRIVYHNKNEHKWLTIQNEMNRRCVVDVFKCLNKIRTPNVFDNYFSRTAHGMNTRGNNNLITVPKVRTEIGKKSFSFQGTVIFNKLPRAIREEISYTKFIHLSKGFYYSLDA